MSGTPLKHFLFDLHRFALICFDLLWMASVWGERHTADVSGTPLM